MKRMISFTLAIMMLFGMVPIAAASNANPFIASIKFDNNLKDDANQEDLKANGNYSYVDGILPGTKALHLESGNGNYVSTPHSLKFGDESFTVSFWYKGDTNNNQVILSNKDYSNGSNAGWAIYTSANSVNMNFGFPTANEKNVSFGRNTFDASNWRHVTFVVNREKMLSSLYIDGYEMAQTTLKLGSLDTSNLLNIGSDGLGNLGSNSFDIAELNIWKGALSSEVVQEKYNSYAVNKVDLTLLNSTITDANAVIAGGLGNGYSETDFDYLKKVFTTANMVATKQKEKLMTQETINYYERELTNAIFIYQKSNKTATPADLNMIVNSDTEISSNLAAIARVEDDFRRSLKVFPKADVMLIPGDVTGGNNAVEYLWMKELTNVYSKLKDEGLFDNIALYLVRGNHDMGGAEQFIPVGSAGAWNESTNSYDNNFFNDAYRVKIKGYNLVVFDGNYDNNNTSGKAKNYLDQITKEPDYDPTKPIFVSSHFPISGTNWGSGWSTSGSNNVGKYIASNNLSQVVYVSGHTHYDPTDERSLFQGAASYFDAGSTNYSSYIDGGPFGGYVEGAYIKYKTTPRISNFMEVYGTKVIIKHYNLSTEEFVGVPSVVNVGEGKDAFTYSRSYIRELIAPQFEEGITVNSINSSEVDFSIKQADDNVRVLEYNVELINKLTGNVDKSFNSLSLPLDKPFDEYRQYKITGLMPKTSYLLRVYAADSMYNRSSQEINITTTGVKLNSITTPAEVSGVDNGTAKTAVALGLPQIVKLETNDGTMDAKVTWNVGASSYDPAIKTAQTFTIAGAVTLPSGMENPDNVPVTTSIRVTVFGMPAVFVKAANYTSSNEVQKESTSDIGGGQHVGYIGVGSWMEYTNIDIPSTGTYTLQYRAAVNKSTGAGISFLIDGVTQKTTTLPNLGGWTSWATVSDKVTLSAGKHTIRLLATTDGFNLNWFKLFAPDKTLVNINAPAAITEVLNGTAKSAEALGLPTTVELVTEEGNMQAPVTWDVDSTTYDVSQKIAQTFTVNGIVALPAGVANPNQVALTTSISVSVLPLSKMPQSTLTGLQQVSRGQIFDVTMGLTSVTQSVYQTLYAQDLTLHYDPAILQLDSITSRKDGFQVIDQKESAPGQIRIMAASVSANVLAQGDLLAFKFTAKAVTQDTVKTTISLDHVVIANEQGNELQVNGTSHEMKVSEQDDNAGKLPAVPTGLTATSASPSQINVTWTNSVDASGYDLMVDEVIRTDLSSPFVHTGLAANTLHTYKVRAKNSAGASEWSTQVSASTQSDTNNGSDNGSDTGTGNGNNANPTPTPTPTPIPTPEPTKPTGDVFNSSIMNVINLIHAIEFKVEEAKKSNVKIDLADLKGHWAEKTVGIFVKLDAIVGYQDGTFHPNGKITRAEFAAIISRIFDVTGSANQVVELNDINSHWAKDAIKKLINAGVIAGYGDGTFKPDNTISREEMVIILSRIMDLSKVDKDASKGNFTDMASASPYAANLIKDAAAAGIISGKGKGEFDPQGGATRAEALTIVLNALNLQPQVKALLDGLN